MRKYLAPALGVLLLIAAAIRLSAAPPAPNTGSKFVIDVSQAQPREVEEATQQAIVRDYSKAWQNMVQALDENRTDLISASFVGFAKDKLTNAVNEQKKNGLKRKLVDREHKLEVLFYSYEGSALQVRDTVQIEVQYLDGGKVLHSEQKTIHYTAVMTPTENAWKVRMLEAQP